MASRSALLALLVAVSCAAAASAASITVGDSSGWTTRFDYAAWASGKTFSVGDLLVFNFPSGAHDVVEVSKSDYDSCSGGNANPISTGPATIALNTTGAHYYICTIPGHCSTSSSSSMKLAITVGSGSGGAPTPSTPGTPGTPNTPNTPSTPSRPGSAAPSRLAAGPALAVAAGVLLKLALF